MNSVIITKAYEQPPFCEKEILRYAGCKSSDDELLQLLRACIDEVRGKLTYKVCYRELPLSIIENDSHQEQSATILKSRCDFQYFSVQSADLVKNLQGCNSVILFAATLGVEIDRLIAKYGRISPSKALMFQAIGAERIESLCDAFCADIQAGIGVHTEMYENAHAYGIRPRFSPGYGDLSLEVQRDIFDLLDCAKRIGLFLNDSLLMSPSKSVTAFVGLTDCPENAEITEKKINENKCARCNKTDCTYRGVS